MTELSPKSTTNQPGHNFAEDIDFDREFVAKRFVWWLGTTTPPEMAFSGGPLLRMAQAIQDRFRIERNTAALKILEVALALTRECGDSLSSAKIRALSDSLKKGSE